MLKTLNLLMKEYVIWDESWMVLLYLHKCTCTNKQKNERGKRNVLQFVRAKGKSNS